MYVLDISTDKMILDPSNESKGPPGPGLLGLGISMAFIASLSKVISRFVADSRHNKPATSVAVEDDVRAQSAVPWSPSMTPWCIRGVGVCVRTWPSFGEGEGVGGGRCDG